MGAKQLQQAKGRKHATNANKNRRRNPAGEPETPRSQDEQTREAPIEGLLKPPTAMPTTPPPMLPNRPRGELSSSDIWALVVFFLGVFATIATIGMYIMHIKVQAGAIEANARLRAAELEVQAATTPTHTRFDCDFTLEGNLQFDGREVNATKQRITQFDPKTWKPVVTTYAGTDIPAGNINVPDFTQFRVNTIKAHCNGEAQLPAKMLAAVIDQ